MIYIITGKTGHGKTAYMVRMMRDELRAGNRIYANIKVRPDLMLMPGRIAKFFGAKPMTVKEGFAWIKKDREDPEVRVLYWQNFSDWQYFENGTVFVDEGLVYFNARKWDALPSSMQTKFVQHRKDKIDLIFNVQHYTFIEKTLRVLCEGFINVELKFGSAAFKRSWIPRLSVVTEIDLVTLNKLEAMNIDPYNLSDEDREHFNIRGVSSSWFWIRKNIFDWYDTSLKVAESRPEPLMHQERTCPEPGCGKIAITHA
jgi:hypothetical protein